MAASLHRVGRLRRGLPRPARGGLLRRRHVQVVDAVHRGHAALNVGWIPTFYDLIWLQSHKPFLSSDGENARVGAQPPRRVLRAVERRVRVLPPLIPDGQEVDEHSRVRSRRVWRRCVLLPAPAGAGCLQARRAARLPCRSLRAALARPLPRRAEEGRERRRRRG